MSNSTGHVGCKGIDSPLATIGKDDCIYLALRASISHPEPTGFIDLRTAEAPLKRITSNNQLHIKKRPEKSSPGEYFL